MTKRDDDDLGLALVSGGVGALLGYGKAQSRIQSLEAEKRDLQNEVFMLRNTLSAKDSLITQLQAELKKVKEEKKGNNSMKSIARSIFDKI